MKKNYNFKKLIFTLTALVALGINVFAQLPYNTTMTQTHYNNNKVVVSSNRASWSSGISLSASGFNWDDKYVVIALNQQSIPYQLKFKFKCSSGVATNPNWYVAESADKSNWTNVWSTESKSTSTSALQTVNLSKSTKYIKLCYSGNFGGTYSDIVVSDQAYVNNPKVGDNVITSLDFGAGAISSGKAEKTFEIEWCNVNTLSVTSDNAAFFSVSPASFGAKAKYGTQEITVTYDRDKEINDHSATITITNGTQTKTVTVSGSTTKRSQSINWNAALTALNYTMNAEESLTGDAIATADNEDAVLTYVSSDENVIAVSQDGTTLYAIDNGTATITATASGDDIYYEATDQKVFTVTSKKKQTITWDQELLGLKTTGANTTIELNAEATSGGVITYAIEGGSAACITLGGENNATLTITGTAGEAYIIATQAGGVIGEEEWIAATYRKLVKVRDPNAACDEYALADQSFTFSQGDKTSMSVKEYNLTGKPTKLTFSAKAGSLKYLWSEREAIYVEQYANFGSGLEWHQVASLKLETSAKNYGPYNLDETATKIRFRSGEYAEQNVSNISIPRKKELLVSETSITEEAERNVRWSKQISVSRSNIDVVDISVESSDTECPFEVNKTSIGTDCADRSTETFEVSITPREKNKAYTGTITITDGKANPTTHTIDLSITAIAFNQSITGFELPETASTTDEIPAFTAAASSGLEVTYFTSDDSIATIINGNQLAIHTAGTVEVTAYQAGDDHYNEVAVTKTIVISKAIPSITAVPTAAAITYGQTLAASALTDGEASVDGSFAWETPEAAPAAGTPAYTVVFTPADEAVYATATAEVTVTVEQAALTVTANNAETVYGEAAPEFTVAYEGFVNDETEAVLGGELAFACDYNAESPVGSYTITPSGLTSGNYAIEFVAGTLIVNKAEAELTLAPTLVENLVYNGLAQTLIHAGEAVHGTLVYSLDGENYDAELPTAVNAGAHTIYYMVEGDANHNNIDADSFNVTIGQAALTVTANNAETVYGEAAPEFSVAYEGFVNEETEAVLGGELAFACDYNAESPVGSYAITPSGLTSGNYAIEFVAGTLTVGKADAALTLAPTAVENLVYNGEAQTLIHAGEAVHGTLVYSLDGENYAAELPTAVDAAEYKVYYMVVGDENYNDVEADSLMVTITEPVVKQFQMIEWENAPELLKAGETVELNAFASSLLDIVYESSDSTIAYVDEFNVLHALQAGTVTITATQPGDDTYEAAEPVAQLITIEPKQGGTTAVDETADATSAVKVIRHGQIFIIRDGRTYTPAGRLVK